MQRRNIFFLIVVLLLFIGCAYFLLRLSHPNSNIRGAIPVTHAPSPQLSPTNPWNNFNLSIAALRAKSYPGSTFQVVQTLTDGSNYHQYIVSYISDGLTIYGLLTIPIGSKPTGGWPAILFNHGYIAPATYQTAPSSGQYASYVAALATQGFVVFKPDYRGNGNSQGSAAQSYVSAGYIDDDLNALSSLEKDPRVNKNKIGMWAHSMGGNITLHDLVITHDVKVAVIWAGVVGSYPQILQWWQTRIANHSISGNDSQTATQIMQMIQQVGDPQKNPAFWNAIDPTKYITDITTPIQLDVSSNDPEVPISFSVGFYTSLKQNGKTVEFYQYPNDDHNISQNFDLAMQRSIDYFNKYLK